MGITQFINFHSVTWIGTPPFLMIPLVRHLYRGVFPMDYILMTILLQEQLWDPAGKQRAQKRNAMLVQRTVDVKMRPLTRIVQHLGNLTITRGLWLTHVDSSCQMKSVLNFDTFLGATTFWNS
ncbi:hypothetical protein NPIL_361501 [Nephila pilipes]|uniref:Uncharacterized protein n=1 Tax=Nephila pilipes TaxID=299642 RepID=A0A8X6Q532_NEPPI|nr:hypothetical protein NPIL_361501 [Nephila pilipes]